MNTGAHRAPAARCHPMNPGVLERLFGTAHFPRERWPEAGGIAGHPVPDGYWHQLAWPFCGRTAP